MPNLIVNDLFMVQPMSSFSGYITYMNYALGTPKNGVGGVDANGELNTVIQDPFVWSAMTEDRMNYSGENVVDRITAEDAANGDFKLSWTPVVKGAFGDGKDVKIISADGAESFAECDTDGKVGVALNEGDRVIYRFDNQMIPQEKLPTVVGRMKGIALTARARRIAISYSQFAAYQA